MENMKKDVRSNVQMCQIFLGLVDDLPLRTSVIGSDNNFCIKWEWGVDCASSRMLSLLHGLWPICGGGGDLATVNVFIKVCFKCFKIANSDTPNIYYAPLWKRRGILLCTCRSVSLNLVQLIMPPFEKGGAYDCLSALRSTRWDIYPKN